MSDYVRFPLQAKAARRRRLNPKAYARHYFHRFELERYLMPLPIRVRTQCWRMFRQGYNRRSIVEFVESEKGK